MLQDEGSETPTVETPPLSPAERFNRLLSTHVENPGEDEPETGAGKAKLPLPVTEPPAEAAETEPEVSVVDENAEKEVSPENAAPRYHPKVDGVEQDVSLDELLKGYSFSAHNTRTAQKLATERKEFNTEREEARELTKQYRAVLPKLEEIAQKAVNEYVGVDWDALRREDPAAFSEHRAAYQLQQDKLNSVRSEREAEEVKLQKEHATEFSSYIEREQASLLERVPEWKDEAKRSSELGKIAEFATKQLGFTAEDIATTFDHRVIQGLRMAYLGSQLDANAESAKRKVSEARKSATPGKRQESASPDDDRLNRARGNLRKSGREVDAAEAFNALLAKKGS